MTLAETLKQDLIRALKDKDQFKAQVLRSIISSIKNAEIIKKESLLDPEVLKILRSESKKRKDSIKAYQEGKREDLVVQEKSELEIIAHYLPAELDPEQVRKKIKEIKDQTGLDQFGPLMGKVMAELGDQVDGSLVQQILKEELN